MDRGSKTKDFFVQAIDRGLNEMSWKSIDLRDYIEEVYGLINMDASVALHTVQHDLSLIKDLALNWSLLHGDIFDQNQQNSSSTFGETLQKHL